MGTATEKTVEALHVSCEMCLKEIPVSAAVVAEATDYFAYFCGLECYEQWKHRGEVKPAEVSELYG